MVVKFNISKLLQKKNLCGSGGHHSKDPAVLWVCISITTQPGNISYIPPLMLWVGGKQAVKGMIASIPWECCSHAPLFALKAH